MPKLTKKVVEGLKPRKHDYRIWDSKVAGFGVRVKPSGSCSYFVAYRTPTNKTRRYTIGRSEQITPSDARKKAIQILAQVSLGHDPMAVALEPVEVNTFGDLAAEYVQRRGSEKSIKEEKRILERDILPVLGDIPVEKVQRRTIVILIDRIRDRGSQVMANRCGFCLFRPRCNTYISPITREIRPLKWCPLGAPTTSCWIIPSSIIP